MSSSSKNFNKSRNKKNMIKITFFFIAILLIIATSALVDAKRHTQPIINNNKYKPIPQHLRRNHNNRKTLRSASLSATPEETCMGEFEMCPNTGACTLIKSRCGNSGCSRGQYICPFEDKVNPANNCASKFSDCPNLKNTFWDWTLTIDERLNLLAQTVSLDDQAKQLSNSAPSIPSAYIPEYQWLNDDLHGLRGSFGTSFCDGVGLGATWSKDTLHQVGSIISKEARAIHHFYVSRGIRGVNPVMNGIGPASIYAPNINLAVKPRWGRDQEVYGADPVHMKGLAKAYIDGMQTKYNSTHTNNTYLQGIACAKHFLAYNVEDFPTVRYKYDAIVNGRNLFESYLPVFRHLVEEAKVGTVMASYNEVNGVPSIANSIYLQGFLRERWGGENVMVVSDYDDCLNLVVTQGVVKNFTAAAALAYNNGMDQEGGGDACSSQLPTCVAEGTVTRATVTTSFKRVMRGRFMLGMFDPPEFIPQLTNINSVDIADNQHEQVSLQAALESATLFRNENNAIPAQVTEGKTSKTLIVGPLAASTKQSIGNYATKTLLNTVSPLEGIVNFLCPFDEGFGTNNTVGFGFYIEPSWEQQYPPLHPVLSMKDCRNFCEQSLRCNFWTYESDTQDCYILPVQGKKTSRMNTVSGARHGLVLTYPGTSYIPKDNSISPVIADDKRECSQLCRVESTCAHFTFDALLSLCYLIPASSSINTNSVDAPSYFISGVSPQKCETVEYVAACADHDLHCKDPSGFQKAAQLASVATQTIVIFGLDQTFAAEGFDRHDYKLPENWYKLFALLRDNSKLLYGIAITGNSFPIDTTLFDALLCFWFPGQNSGRAIASVLFGEYAPAGRTAIDWYKSGEDLWENLAYENLYPNKSTGFKGISYRYFDGDVNIPFGFGLTLPTFDYDNLAISPLRVFDCDVITVNFTVTARLGTPFAGFSDEVAQVYIKQLNSTVPVPKVRLVNFTRIKQVPSSSGGAFVTLEISPRDRLTVLQNDETPHLSKEVVETGELEIFVGGGQPGFFANGLMQKIQVLSTGKQC